MSIQGVASRFARERLRPGYQKREQEGRVDRDLYREMDALALRDVMGLELARPERFNCQSSSLHRALRGILPNGS